MTTPPGCTVWRRSRRSFVEIPEQRIVAGTLKPGQRMVEEGPSKAFGVSRPPGRDAFQILESQDFVIREPRKGISVVNSEVPLSDFPVFP